jgi:hypothetical protein
MDTFDLHQEWILSVPKMSRNRRKQKARLAKVMAEMQLEENEKMNISDIDEEVGKNSGDEGRGPKEEAPKAEAPAELAELQRRMNARNRFLALLFEAWRRATCVGPSGTCGSSDTTSGSSSTGSLHLVAVAA